MVQPCDEGAELIAFDGLLDCPELIDGPVRLHDQNFLMINAHGLKCRRIRRMGWCKQHNVLSGLREAAQCGRKKSQLTNAHVLHQQFSQAATWPAIAGQLTIQQTKTAADAAADA